MKIWPLTFKPAGNLGRGLCKDSVHSFLFPIACLRDIFLVLCAISGLAIILLRKREQIGYVFW